MDSAVYAIASFIILFFCALLWATQSWKGDGHVGKEDAGDAL